MSLDKAVISWYGLPEDRTAIAGGEAAGTFVFVVTATAEDLVGIAQRMQATTEVDQPVFRAGLSQAEMREAYNAMSAAERGKYGSFARYCAMRMVPEYAPSGDVEQPDGKINMILPELSEGVGTMDGAGAADMTAVAPSEGVGGRKVVHVDVPEEAAPELPAAVWVAVDDLTQGQGNMASDRRGVSGETEYLLQVDMLTAEQREKYGADHDGSADGGLWAAAYRKLNRSNT